MSHPCAHSHPDPPPRRYHRRLVDLNVVDRARSLANELRNDEALRQALRSVLGPIEAKFVGLLLQASASAEKPEDRRGE